ncbi:MAG: HEAT repeat domain-containing protein [Cytophagia bacterium]|nr:MAG: HEAT repeat domain-containing protein [Cytophagia bacterium]TAG44326.1 MAG: HEAT repeat domain-containing protein [Cytophagia bacterium]
MNKNKMMDTNEIKILLEKYDEGQTSLEEEKKLKKYFQENKNIPKEWKIYQQEFDYFIQQSMPFFKQNEQESWQKLTTKINNQLPKKRLQFSLNIKIMSGIAAGILLLSIGFVLGKLSNHTKQNTENLSVEIQDLKQIMMQSLLKNNSAGDRLQAVQYATEIKKRDKDDVKTIVNTLAETLQNDENTNVRLAAANALLGYKDDYPNVTSILVKALSNQDDPVVQIALINSLLALKIKEAKKPIEKILEEQKMPEEVKKMIEVQLKNI